jgi:hypothetical protein
MWQNELLNKILKLIKRNLIIKIFINLLENIFNLLLSLIESQTRKQSFNFRSLNKPTVILIMTIEQLLQLTYQLFGQVIRLNFNILLKTKSQLEIKNVYFVFLVGF